MAWIVKTPCAESLAGRRFAKAFGANLEAMRRQRGIFKAEAAAMVGTKRSIYRSYELGHALPPLRMLLRIAAALGVQPGELLPEVRR